MPYCQYCGDHFDEMKVKTQHVKKCTNNPRIIAIVKKKHSMSTAEVDKREMLDRIHSYDDIFDEVDKFLDTRGYYVKWKSRPSQFNTAIKADYFDQPDINRNEEKIYVGWEGDFIGQFYNKDGTNADISFWDLTGNMGGIYNLTFLKSGGGGWSSSFSGKGTIFVEDFPHLFKKYHNVGFDERYNVKIQQQVDNILQQISIDETNLLHEDNTLNGLTDVLESIGCLEQDIRKARDLHRSYISKKFQSEVTVDLPVLEIPFVNTGNYNSFADTYKRPLKDEAPTVDITAFKDALNNIKINADEYTKQYAEHFI